MDQRPIGMFDSGVGGLTVLKEIRRKIPNEKIIYLGDTNNFPYGSKSKETIIRLSRKCMDYLVAQNVKLVITACGTVTSQAIDELKTEYNTPIIGIIEPTVEYISKTYKKDKETIGIIATSGTIRSCAWEKKIRESIKNIEIINEKTPLLAIMAEEGWINNKAAKFVIKEYMKCFNNVDRLVLGCTHYPLFEELIKRELKRKTEIINTGRIISEYIKRFIENNAIENDKTRKDFEVLITDDNKDFKRIGEIILCENLNSKIKEIKL